MASGQIEHRSDDDRARSAARRRGLVIGLIVAAVGTVVNKILGYPVPGRILVATGAALALFAFYRSRGRVTGEENSR